VKGLVKKFLPISISRKLSRGAQTYRNLRYYRLAKSQIELIKSLPDSPFKRVVRVGFMRGIDFYSSTELVSALALAMKGFQSVHGILPNLLDPNGFNEKIVWAKFFTEMKIPESGNKLLTAKFIPEDIRHLIQCPRICWHSILPKLPKNDEVNPGYYYLKANHGSGMCKRISYPLSNRQFVDLEATCQKWLETPFGIGDGEWWYNVFPKEVLLEVDVARRDGSISYEFFVLNGQIGLIHIRRKKVLEVGLTGQLTRFAANFDILPASLQDKGQVEELPDLTDDTKSKMRIWAITIGRQFPFARVDFLLDEDQRIYLGEVTFAPFNALARRPKEIDVSLGQMWVLG
jgi:hypothetical protein